MLFGNMTSKHLIKFSIKKLYFEKSKYWFFSKYNLACYFGYFPKLKHFFILTISLPPVRVPDPQTYPVSG